MEERWEKEEGCGVDGVKPAGCIRKDIHVHVYACIHVCVCTRSTCTTPGHPSTAEDAWYWRPVHWVTSIFTNMYKCTSRPV